MDKSKYNNVDGILTILTDVSDWPNSANLYVVPDENGFSLLEKKTHTLLAGDLVGKAPAWYLPAAGGVVSYPESLTKLEALDAAILLPAHGLLSKKRLRLFRKFKGKCCKEKPYLKKHCTMALKVLCS